MGGGMGADAQSLLLTLLGAAVIRIAADNTFEQYVRAGLRPWLMIAGIVLAAIGVVALARDHVPRFQHRHANADSEVGPNGGSRMRVAWLLVLPVLAIFIVAPGPLGAYSATRGGGGVGAAPRDANGFAPLPAGDPAPDTVRDFSERALWDDGRTLQGRRISLTGFVTPRDGGSFYLTRMMITCCAADATPIKVTITGDAGAHLANTWLTVTGTFAGVDHANATDGRDPVPILHAETVNPVRPPTNPYES
jgi:uncharacterized repeat protein (TIGR03943 family)